MSFVLPSLTAGIFVSLACAPCALAQVQPSPSSGMVQSTEPGPAAALNENLTRLAKNPRDVDALAGAGEAALALGDPRAATGFFARAEQVEGRNGRVKAGLGRVMLKMEKPDEALRLFSEAVKLGYSERQLYADRGLALDLAGRNADAQRDYQAALKFTPADPILIRRYAISLGISGRLQESEKLLEPLLYSSDRAAWRDRAFILAMNGQADRARTITHQVMPAQLADAIQPYMDRMAALNPAQRAAAVHFGRFPADGMKLAVQPPTPAAPQVAQAAPQMSAKERRKSSRARREAEQAAAVIPAPSARTEVVQPIGGSRQERPAEVVHGQVQSAAQKQAESTAGPSVQVPVPAPSSAPASGALAANAANMAKPGAAGPVDPRGASGAIAQPAPAQPAPVQPVSTQAPSVQPAPAGAIQPVTPSPSAAPRTLADIMRELAVPDAEKREEVVPVNLAEIAYLQSQRRKAQQEAAAKAAAEKAAAEKVAAKIRAEAEAKAEAKAKAKAEAEEKAKAKANPARIWVQILTGRSIPALGRDYDKLQDKYSVLKSKTAWTSEWGSTNRLVVGPFTTSARAKGFVSDYKKTGGDGFVWESTEGLEVVKLP